MALKTPRKLLLSLSVAAALGCGAGNAFADGDRVQELEARVAELEALMAELLNQPKPEADPCCENVDAQAAAIAEEGAGYGLDHQIEALGQVRQTYVVAPAVKQAAGQLRAAILEHAALMTGQAPEALDLIVDLAGSQPGCLGARMTGAGFGGCAIALVEESRAAELADRVSELYRDALGLQPEAYVCGAADGVGITDASRGHEPA